MNNIVDMSAEVREAKSRFGIVGNAPALVARSATRPACGSY